jgi:hypothetical protein
MHRYITRKYPKELPLSQTSKNVIFLFLSLVLFLLKIGEQEGRTSSAWEGGTSGREELNMVQKVCTHVCKCKNDTC